MDLFPVDQEGIFPMKVASHLIESFFVSLSVLLFGKVRFFRMFVWNHGHQTSSSGRVRINGSVSLGRQNTSENAFSLPVREYHALRKTTRAEINGNQVTISRSLPIWRTLMDVFGSVYNKHAHLSLFMQLH